MPDVRLETDSLGCVEVAADKLWGAQTQRSLKYFNIGQDLIPWQMIPAYARRSPGNRQPRLRRGRSRQALGRADPAVAQILQYRAGPDPVADDPRLCQTFAWKPTASAASRSQPTSSGARRPSGRSNTSISGRT